MLKLRPWAFKQVLLWQWMHMWARFTPVVRLDRKRSVDCGDMGSKENICLKEESSGPCNELHVICPHSCVISKVMWLWANTPAERHAGSEVESCQPTLGDLSYICQIKYTSGNRRTIFGMLESNFKDTSPTCRIASIHSRGTANSTVQSSAII